MTPFSLGAKALITICFIPITVFAVIWSSPCPAHGFETNLTKQQKVLWTNLGGIAAISLWGVVNWDYFERSPKRGDEGWFSINTKEGGADKFGHFHQSYFFSHVFSGLYNNWGYSKKQSALYGSLTSLTLMSWMEIGDSFSDYGFSHEDFIMNLMGCAAGYCLSTWPELERKIDFRIEYVPDFKETDFFTDYENAKYVMALKFDGFDAVTNPFLKHLELQLGYYARGYSNGIDKERIIYMGVGINLSSIFKKYSMPKTAKFFNYYQVPYTYLPIERDLND